MKANQESILELIQEGKLDQAIKCFLEVTRQHDKSLYNQGILQSANFNSLKTDVINSMLSPEQANIRRSRIGFFMTELVGKLDPTWEVEVNLIAKKPVQEKESPKTSDQVTKKILFLAANPSNLTQVGTGREAELIKEALRRSDHRDSFEIVTNHAVTIPGIQRALLQEKPAIIHFSGHGSNLGKLAFEDAQGNSFEVSPGALADLFELFQGRGIEAVLLNACYSEAQAKEIGKNIQYVIGMNEEVYDNNSLEFSRAFYDAIGAGEDIPFAFRLGKNAVSFQSMPESEKPCLLIDGEEQL